MNLNQGVAGSSPAIFGGLRKCSSGGRAPERILRFPDNGAGAENAPVPYGLQVFFLLLTGGRKFHLGIGENLVQYFMSYLLLT